MRNQTALFRSAASRGGFALAWAKEWRLNPRPLASETYGYPDLRNLPPPRPAIHYYQRACRPRFWHRSRHWPWWRCGHRRACRSGIRSQWHAGLVLFQSHRVGFVCHGVRCIFAGIWASRYTKVGPNEVLVISGRKHRYGRPRRHRARARLPHRQGRRHFVWPVIEKVDILSLELLTIDVQTPGGLYEQGRAGEGGRRGADQGQGRRHLHRHRRRAVPQQGHRRHQEHRHADAGRPPARHPRHDDGRGDLPEPRRLRLQGPGSGRRRHGQHGPGHRQLHHPRHPRHARATSTPSASRASPRSNATPRSPRPRPTATR
jgi:hypothetical protein